MERNALNSLMKFINKGYWTYKKMNKGSYFQRLFGNKLVEFKVYSTSIYSSSQLKKNAQPKS